MKWKFFLLFTIYYLIFNIDKADASALSLGISPPIIQIEAEVPANIKTPLTIQNLGDEEVSLSIFFKPFTAKETENGEVRYLTPTESFGADPLIFQKIQIRDGDHQIQNVVLAPRQQKNLTLHLGIGKNDPPSDYYFSIVFVNNPKLVEGLVEGSNLSQTIGGIATNVILSVGPKGKAKGIIEEFSVPFLLEKGPVAFLLRVKNTGDHAIVPRGEILIQNMFGQTIGKVELLPVNILAGTIRAIPDFLQSPDATISSNSKFEIRNSKFPKIYWPETFILGPYRATLTIALSPQGPLFTKTIHFVGFPFQVLAGLIVAVILTLIVRNRLKVNQEK